MVYLFEHKKEYMEVKYTKNLLLFTLEVQGPEVTTAISKVTARGEEGQL